MASLLLDETNPRFSEPATSQRDALNKLLADAPHKIVNLAEDISNESSVNPTELPVCVVEDGALVVIEGNRRLAALKLLRNPDLADDDVHSSSFRAIAKGGQGPESLFCYTSPDREAARHWLELRHTGENDGLGVVEWQAWQSNNFRRRRGSQADRATIFCSAVAADFPDEAELLADIATVRRERLTTLGRLVADPEVRSNFGFNFVDDGIEFYFEREHIFAGMQQIFGDLAGDVGVSQIKSKEQRATYIKKAAEAQALPPRGERRLEPRSPGTNGENTAPDQSADPPGGTALPHTRRKMPREENVIFKGLKLRHVDLRTSKVLTQAQGVDIATAPAVAAVMLRVVLELTVTEVVLKFGLGKDEISLKKKIAAVLRRLDPNIENPVKREASLATPWIRSQSEDGGVAVQAMHAYVHNVMTNPTVGEVRELSRTFRPLLEQADALLAADT